MFSSSQSLKRSHYVYRAGFKLTATLLPQPPHHLLLFHFSFSEGLLHLPEHMSPFIPRSVCSDTPASLYLQHGIHSPITGCSLSCLNYSGKHPYKQHLSELFRQPDDFFLLIALCKNMYLVKLSLAYAFPFLIFICPSWLPFCSVFTACLLAIRFSFPFLFFLGANLQYLSQ